MTQTRPAVESLLARYEARAKEMTDATLFYALADVADTIKVVDPELDSDYGRKIYAEFDAYTVELQKRRNRK